MVVFEFPQFFLEVLVIVNRVHPVGHGDLFLDVLFSLFLLEDFASQLEDAGILRLACELFVQVESRVQPDPGLGQHLQVLLDSGVLLKRLENQIFQSFVLSDSASVQMGHRTILEGVVQAVDR